MRGEGRDEEILREKVRKLFPDIVHLLRRIDATLLRPQATEKEYVEFLREAADAGFRCAVVPPCYLPIARQELGGSSVRPATVIGFPFGYNCTDEKKGEAVFALRSGAMEMDMVINISALRSGRYRRVKEDIAAVVGLARRYDAGKGEGHVVVKVILETGYLDKEEIRCGALLAAEAGADFVKTSTGFGPRGATPEEVAFLRELVGGKMGVKASGGIRNLADVVEMVEAGADRVGTSAAGDILREYLRYYSWK